MYKTCRIEPFETPHLVPPRLHDPGDVGQVHLDGVLVLVGLQGHDLELPGGEELARGRPVHREVVQGGLVAGAGRDGAATQADVVGGALSGEGGERSFSRIVL